METQDKKTDRFKRIAEYRVKNVLKTIRILGNCSNKSAYTYTEVQIEKIFSTITEYLSSTRGRFSQSNKDIDFKL